MKISTLVFKQPVLPLASFFFSEYCTFQLSAQTFLHFVSLPTFDLVAQLAALVLRVVHDGRRRRRSEAVFLHLAPVPFFPGHHALATLPLVQVVPGLGEVHVEATRVLLVRAGAQTDAITCRRNRGLFFLFCSCPEAGGWKVREGGGGGKLSAEWIK